MWARRCVIFPLADGHDQQRLEWEQRGRPSTKGRGEEFGPQVLREPRGRYERGYFPISRGHGRTRGRVGIEEDGDRCDGEEGAAGQRPEEAIGTGGNPEEAVGEASRKYAELAKNDFFVRRFWQNCGLGSSSGTS